MAPASCLNPLTVQICVLETSPSWTTTSRPGTWTGDGRRVIFSRSVDVNGEKIYIENGEWTLQHPRRENNIK